jgi:hypothetical protein
MGLPIFPPATLRKPQCISVVNDVLIKIRSFRMSFVISPSLRFWYSVYVLIAFPLGKYRAIDRSPDPKGKLQLTVF